MKGYESFVKGYKPAYLADHMYHMDDVTKLKKFNYPYVFDNHAYGGSTIFFANEDLKRQYMKDISGIETCTDQDIIITGKHLGYPPVACQFYANTMHNEELKAKRAFYDYYGIRFAGNIDDAKSIAIWLWENVPAPSATVEVRYQGETQFIEPSVITV